MCLTPSGVRFLNRRRPLPKEANAKPPKPAPKPTAAAPKVAN